MGPEEMQRLIAKTFSEAGWSRESLRQVIDGQQESRRNLIGVEKDQIVVCADCDQEGIAGELCCIGRDPYDPDVLPFDFFCVSCVQKDQLKKFNETLEE